MESGKRDRERSEQNGNKSLQISAKSRYEDTKDIPAILDYVEGYS
jgi:hypothetical protein